MKMENDFIGGTPASEAPAEVAPVIDTNLPSETVFAPTTIQVPDETVSMQKAAEAVPVAEAEPEPAAEPKPDFESMFHAERLAHDVTKAKVAALQKFHDAAKAMGFSGAGIHTGA